MASSHADHDSDDPLAYLNAIEVAWLAADSTNPMCRHCAATATVVPMSGAGWALDVTHEDDCPIVRESEG
jgi:hypothetical protein